MILSDKELLKINGGTITASLINAIARGISTIADLGRNVGTAIRRLVSGKICSI